MDGLTNKWALGTELGRIGDLLSFIHLGLTWQPYPDLHPYLSALFVLLGSCHVHHTSQLRPCLLSFLTLGFKLHKHRSLCPLCPALSPECPWHSAWHIIEAQYLLKSMNECQATVSSVWSGLPGHNLLFSQKVTPSPPPSRDTLPHRGR